MNKGSAKARFVWAAALLVAVLVVAGLLGRKSDSSQQTAQPMVAPARVTTAARVTTTWASPSPSLVSAQPLSTVRSPATTALEAGSPLAAPQTVTIVSTAPAARAAVITLQQLRVAGRAPKTGYSRTRFGQAWTDDTAVEGGHNGCDTRNDILRRDLRQLTVRPGSHGCVVTSGTFTDPYTAKTLAFSSSSAAVQIDHVVALSNAWQTGAAALSSQQRQDLANDPLNLQATASAVNQAKGDGDAATWLPPNRAYRCTYVARQVAVKQKYALWVTTAERHAISTVLTGCGATAATQPVSPVSSTTTIESAPAITSAGADVFYQSCAAARAAGAAPLHRGDSGYRAGLDRDDDGIACE